MEKKGVLNIDWLGPGQDLETASDYISCILLAFAVLALPLCFAFSAMSVHDSKAAREARNNAENNLNAMLIESGEKTVEAMSNYTELRSGSAETISADNSQILETSQNAKGED